METSKLKKFAQFARRSLIEQVSNKLKLVLADGSAARRESAEAVKKLEEQIKANDKGQVVEQVAYTWFNRFCALRFMDVNRYTRIGVVSPAEGQFQPEILAESKMGHIDEGMVPDTARQQIFALLDGNAPSNDPQSEAYRLLVVAACNDYHKAIPYLFERIADYTELLMPDDLLSGNSILAYTREAMTTDACQDVEVIGWLYQFYISEKKDEVFEGLKKNKKITPENIPAATQLFTPHWIVRYLVENSLGRLWMLNRPDSRLIEQMDYYIKPEGEETDFLRISGPEEIKICDPACGSGHMLTYSFDLLYAIYEEEGYEPAEIPEKILTQNLYGIEIDERAGELAAFALTMKARAKQRRFFRKQVQPSICVLENIHFGESELKEYMDFIGRDLFTTPLQTTLRQFEEADNFGSLIRTDLTDVAGALQLLEAKDVSGQLFLSETHRKVLQALQQADYLSPKYHVVIANPPYMGSRNMNGHLQVFAKNNYQWSKSDLFGMFLERSLELSRDTGMCALITIQNWLFISSFEALRKNILEKYYISSLIQIGFNSFPELNSKFALACAFVIEKDNKNDIGIYFDLNDASLSADKNQVFQKKLNKSEFYAVSQNSFRNIPGNPIAYWVQEKFSKSFVRYPKLGSVATTRKGMVTARNEIYVRSWFEVSLSECGLDKYPNRESARTSNKKWFSYLKGGGFRKWYGNKNDIVNWQGDGEVLQKTYHPTEDRVWATNFNLDYIFKPNINWGAVSLEYSARFSKGGELFDAGGSACFPKKLDGKIILGFLNSKITRYMLKILNSSLNIQAGNIADLPVKSSFSDRQINIVDRLIVSHCGDWNDYEISWDFTSLPLLQSDYLEPTLKATYQKLLIHWQEMTLDMQHLEEENNRIFIESYGLQDELTSEVPLREITLTCNPYYRYSGSKSEQELEALLLADTVKEFISYAVGCMFGRYALDKPGLILANQGETIDDYLKQILEPSFRADDDNVIPMLDGDWFTDDITERFFKFLRATFGEQYFEDNLKYVEQSIGKDVRKYFLKDFYNDHVKRYKKRPIYWLFSSPKGSFNALIYMHRYRPDTVSVVLNDYLREFRTKLTARKNHLEAVSISASASQGEKTRALKEIEKLNKMIAEMEEYEREVLYTLATEQVEIDLDDGVKVNYNKFGVALKKIPGLSVKGK